MCVFHWSVIENNAKMFCDILFLLDLWVTWGPLCWFLLGSFMGLLVGQTDKVSVGLAGPRWPPSCIWNLVLAITVNPGSPRDLSSRRLHLLLTWSFLDGTPGKGRHLSGSLLVTLLHPVVPRPATGSGDVRTDSASPWKCRDLQSFVHDTSLTQCRYHSASVLKYMCQLFYWMESLVFVSTQLLLTSGKHSNSTF